MKPVAGTGFVAHADLPDDEDDEEDNVLGG